MYIFFKYWAKSFKSKGTVHLKTKGKNVRKLDLWASAVDGTAYSKSVIYRGNKSLFFCSLSIVAKSQVMLEYTIDHCLWYDVIQT